MSQKLTLDIIRQLPKAELHCHLDGFVRPETVWELAEQQGVTLPVEVKNLEELAQAMQCPVECHDLVTYLKCFDITCAVMQYAYAITRILYEACEDAVKDGITYLELRFAPALHTKKGLTYSQIIEAAIDGCTMAEEKLPITVRIICCAMRHMTPEQNAEISEICWRYRHRYVVGFDCAGPENGFPPHKHIEAFRKVRERNVSLTIHAGEAYGPESIDSALRCSAQRIGHGTRIMEDEGILQEVIDRRVPLEICVTSNVQTQAAKDFESHPIKKLYDLGVRTVPCTDNPIVSNVTLSGEYLLLHEKFGFRVDQILRMMDYGFRAAFISEGAKKRLRVEAFVKAMKILKENNIDVSGIETHKDYYANIGVTVPPKFEPPVKNPPLTLELMKQIPKCDTDCRLSGSVPYPVIYKLWERLSETDKKKLGYDFNCEEDVVKFCNNEDPKNFHKHSKKMVMKLLQDEESLKLGVFSVIEEAIKDNVIYMELTVNPFVHTAKGLDPEQVMSICISAVKECTEGKAIMVNIVISVDIAAQTILQVQKAAQLAVQFKKNGIIGFTTTTQEILADHMKYYEEIFEYLRKNHVPVTIFTGEQDVRSVQAALVSGHARRISGGFLIAQSDSLLTDVASHNVAVLISPSVRLEQAVSPVAKSAIRFFFDFGIKVGFCSINSTFTNMTRSEQLMKMAEESGLDALSMMKIMSNSFASIFVENAVSKRFQHKYWEDSVQLLGKHGFTRFLNYEYFVEC